MILHTLLTALCPSLPQQSIPVREVLAVESLGEHSRSALNTDALESALALGTWSAPSEGDVIQSATGEERTWTRTVADESGLLEGKGLRGGWAYASVEVPTTGAWRLDLFGATSVLVDGEPHYGDPYQLGLTRIPLSLEAGSHELLFRTGRGQMRANLEAAPATVYLEDKDRTLPNVLRGEAGPLWAGLVVSNAGSTTATDYQLRATVAGREPALSRVPALLPSSLHKCGLRVPVTANLEADKLPVQVELLAPTGDVVHTMKLTLEVRDPGSKHVRTFRSAIDGSVQYFGVTPPASRDEASEKRRPALFLSLHGANVEGSRQAQAYSPKEWGYVVAPTNRRAYGFDWEDWGRMDALEVLELSERLFGTDPRRTYLTGHSMGGHGTWQIGAHFPDRFAAIAPSAGWRDFWSYGGAIEVDEEDAISALMLRSTNPSRTLLLKENYLHSGVYILHGDADSNVPVDEARAMRSLLADSHPNFAYYERPGAGHWWGDECMDWDPLFDFLSKNTRPLDEQVLDVQFTTISPAISNRCYWVEVEAQEDSLVPSHVRAAIDVNSGVVELESKNVRRLAFDFSTFSASATIPTRVRVGEQEFSIEQPFSRVLLEKDAVGGWQLASPIDRAHKGSHRAGPFKDAFRNRMVFVYGTGGTSEENLWSLAKARFDHETWRYRGNGAVDVVADTDFNPAAFADRGVVLYGNADTNLAWSKVLDPTEIELRRDFVRIGSRKLEGDDLALLAIRRRKDSSVASVAIIGGTGLAGCRTTDHRSYFVSGVGYPDWTIMGCSVLRKGVGGIRAAGFFGPTWSAENGANSAWR